MGIDDILLPGLSMALSALGRDRSILGMSHRVMIVLTILGMSMIGIGIAGGMIHIGMIDTGMIDTGMIDTGMIDIGMIDIDVSDALSNGIDVIDTWIEGMIGTLEDLLAIAAVAMKGRRADRVEREKVGRVMPCRSDTMRPSDK